MCPLSRDLWDCVESLYLHLLSFSNQVSGIILLLMKYSNGQEEGQKNPILFTLNIYFVSTICKNKERLCLLTFLYTSWLNTNWRKFRTQKAKYRSTLLLEERIPSKLFWLWNMTLIIRKFGSIVLYTNSSSPYKVVKVWRKITFSLFVQFYEVLKFSAPNDCHICHFI